MYHQQFVYVFDALLRIDAKFVIFSRVGQVECCSVGDGAVFIQYLLRCNRWCVYLQRNVLHRGSFRFVSRD